jgi:hypothetical protein
MRTVVSLAVCILAVAIGSAIAIVLPWLLVRLFFPEVLFWHAVVFMWLFTLLVAVVHYGQMKYRERKGA